MKYIKTFEDDTWRSIYTENPGNTIYYNTEESLKKYKFKIGDFVKIDGNTNIYEITGIDRSPIDWNQPEYRLCSINNDEIGTWEKEKNLILVPDYEVDAVKYNM